MGELPDMKTDKQVLIEAKQLISDPSKWCQNSLARDENEVSLSNGFDSRACRWCAYGAVDKVLGGYGMKYTDDFTRITDLLDESAKDFGFDSAPALNDSRGHEYVIRMYDKAIHDATLEVSRETITEILSVRVALLLRCRLEERRVGLSHTSNPQSV